ncbi:MAG: hypothetical protein GXP35_01895 [Actinobacteria bacterium]|nr:hypothetical protein [Actinomycetota bacterium]
MNFDDQATKAGAAISERAEALTPHRSGLSRRRWVAPVGVGALLVVALGVASLVGLGLGATSRVETVAGLDGPIPVVDGVDDRLLAAFVSIDGEVTVLSGDPASPTIQRLDVDAPPPILDVSTIPKPRWTSSGRVIEYVTQLNDRSETVSVDVPTGRITTEPYSVPDLTFMRTAGLLDPDLDEPHDRTLMLMRASSFPFVIAVGEGSEVRWWVRSVAGGRGRVYDIDSIEFLAPGPDSLIVIADGSLSLIGADRDIQPYAPDGVPDMVVRSAAVGPAGETAFGFADATVFVETGNGVASFELGDQFGAVTELSWDQTGASVYVQTLGADPGDQALHQCSIGELACSRVDVGAMGSLVRGSPQALAPHDVLNIWPGESVSSDTAADAPWRLDPTLLVTQFAVEVFSWDEPLVVRAESLATHQRQVAFDVRRSAEESSFRITVSQTDGQSGWFVSEVRRRFGGPEMAVGLPFDGIATFQIERQGAAVVEVTLNIEGVTVSGRAIAGDEVRLDFGEYRFDPGQIEPSSGFLENVGYFFVLLRDEDGVVFQAFADALVSGLGPGQPFG